MGSVQRHKARAVDQQDGRIRLTWFASRAKVTALRRARLGRRPGARTMPLCPILGRDAI